MLKEQDLRNIAAFIGDEERVPEHYGQDLQALAGKVGFSSLERLVLLGVNAEELLNNMPIATKKVAGLLPEDDSSKEPLDDNAQVMVRLGDIRDLIAATRLDETADQTA